MAIDWDGLVLGPVMGAFGEKIVYTPRGGAPIVIPDAVFDEESADIAIGEDGQVSTQQKPTCGIRQAALLGATASQGDSVRRDLNGRIYLVREPIPDGHGHIRLMLMTKAGQ